jgi:hypothetical protein
MKRLVCLVIGHRWSPWRNERHARVRWRDGKPYELVIARRSCERCLRKDALTLRGGRVRTDRLNRVLGRLLG